MTVGIAAVVVTKFPGIVNVGNVVLVSLLGSVVVIGDVVLIIGNVVFVSFAGSVVVCGNVVDVFVSFSDGVIVGVAVGTEVGFVVLFPSPVANGVRFTTHTSVRNNIRFDIVDNDMVAFFLLANFRNFSAKNKIVFVLLIT